MKFLWVYMPANLSAASFSGAAIDVFDDDSVDDDDIDDFLRRFNVPGTEKILSNWPKLGVEPRTPSASEKFNLLNASFVSQA